jgi:hypothetical protein
MMEQFAKLLDGPAPAPKAVPAPKAASAASVPTPTKTMKPTMDVVVRAVVLVKDLPKGGTLGNVRKELESRGILECEVDFSGVAEVKGDTVLRAGPKQGAVIDITPKTEVKPTPKVEAKPVAKPTPEGFEKALKDAVVKTIVNSKSTKPVDLKQELKTTIVKSIASSKTLNVVPNTAILSITGKSARVYLNPTAKRAFKANKLHKVLN